MFCRRCGKEIADDTKFCRFCGTEIISVMDEDVSINDLNGENYSDVDAAEVFPVSEEYTISTPEAEKGNKRLDRKLLIILSAVLILGALVAAIILSIRVLIPSLPDPVKEESVVVEVQTPAPSPEPSAVTPSLPVSPAAKPSAAPTPIASPSPSPVVAPSQTPSPTPTPAPTPTSTPTHDASQGNITVTGSKYVDNVSYGAYFRSAPEDGENVIKTILLGTKVDFIEAYNSIYTKVRYDGRYGYIQSEFLSNSKPNLTVTKDAYIANVDCAAYLRCIPSSTESAITTSVYLDTKLGYIEKDGNYIKVKYGDYYGYVHQDYISYTPPDTSVKYNMYIVGVDQYANHWAYPRQNTTVLQWIPLGAKVGYVADSFNNYCKVSYNGQIGYVYRDYLSSTVPAFTDGTLGLGAGQYKALNVFMSNFSEVFMDSFEPETADGYTLLKYVYLHYKINNRDQIGVSDGSYTMTKETVDYCLDRFFGITLSPGDYHSTKYPNEYFTYSNGMYYTPASDGESYNWFTVVDELHPNNDGSMTITFDVYELDLRTYFDLGMPGDLYEQTAESVKSCGYSIAWKQDGQAVIREYVLSDGSKSYQLLSYTVYD